VSAAFLDPGGRRRHHGFVTVASDFPGNAGAGPTVAS
jgi:hypothetical protein